MHARENERTYNSDATLRLGNVTLHIIESHPTQAGLLSVLTPKVPPHSRTSNSSKDLKHK